MSAAIQIDAVTRDFGRFQALRGVTLEVREGEFFALLGPNGAGKTTLISVLAGLVRPTSGSARILGHDVVHDAARARRLLGVVPQELVFDPFFNVRETLRITSGYYGIRRNDAWIDEILHHLGLTDKAATNMRALSGGMKRRVLVAQALVHRPPVIVLDEPTAGVDVELRQTLWSFVRRLNREGHTIVLTTHYLEEAQELCERVAMLKQGRIIALDRTASLLQRYASGALAVRMSGADLPASLQDRLLPAPESDPRVRLSLEHHGEIESILTTLRLAGCRIEDMEIVRTDLEDVFMRLMAHDESGPAAADRLSRPAAPATGESA